MSKPYIVVFDDEMGVCMPFGFDTDIEGALCVAEPIAVFPNRKAARKVRDAVLVGFESEAVQ